MTNREVRRLRLLTLSILTAVATPALSQSYSIDERFGGGPAGNTLSPPRSVAQIEAGTKNSTATISYTFVQSSLQDNAGKTSAWTLSLSSPIDKSDDITDLATLDGLANAFTFSVNYASYSDDVERNTVRLRALRDQIRRDSGDPNKALSPSTIAEVYGPLGRDEEVLAELRGAFRLLHSRFWSVKATVGREEFKYVDFTDFERESDTEVGWAFTLRGGFMLGSWVLAGEAKIEDAKKNADATTQCRPIADSINLDCLTGPSGVPVDNDARLLGVEARRQFSRFGISPSIRYDFEKEVLAADFPVFLWQDSKKQLTGGVRAGWRNDTDDLVFGLFVTSPFSLY